MNKTKKCSKCKIIKSYDEYYIRPNGKPYSQCDPCKINAKKEWYKKDMENKDKYDINGKVCPHCEEYKLKDKFYILKQNGQMSTYCIICELDKYNWNKPNRKTTKNKWRQNNQDKIKISNLKYYHEVRKFDEEYMIIQTVRGRIHSALNSQNVKKNHKTIDLLGCDIIFYKKWLEFSFNCKMNWENKSIYWEIDHVVPCAKYDLKIIEHQKECFHWSNTRPLESKQNSSKKDKIIEYVIFIQKLNVVLFKKFNKRQIQIAGTS